jgi:hypothetical protein
MVASHQPRSARAPTAPMGNGAVRHHHGADTPRWLPVAGLVLGGLTLLFFMVLIFRAQPIPCELRFPLVAVLSFGAAMASAVFGGWATAEGKLPLTPTATNALRISAGGGIAVLLILLVLGNHLYRCPPPTSNFPLTVYVHGEAGRHDLILRDQGSVLLDLGGDRRSEPIRDKGQAFFAEIPANFSGQMVSVSLDAAGYELVDPSPRRLDGSSLYLAVRRKPVRLTGRIQDKDGKPVIGANITVAGIPATSNPSGRFELTIPGDRLQPDLSLQVIANGYDPWHGTIVPGGAEMTVSLTRHH